MDQWMFHWIWSNQSQTGKKTKKIGVAQKENIRWKNDTQYEHYQTNDARVWSNSIVTYVMDKFHGIFGLGGKPDDAEIQNTTVV